MKKFVVISFALLLGFLPQLRADEGMWIPSLISKNIAIMQKLGCQLTAEEIYSNTSPSIKDAIIIFGGGCTGEIVSPEGLIFTNHHCGFGSIQKVSTVEHDYLKDGFWAYSKDKEIPIEGLTVKFLVYMKDVTGQALDSVTNTMSEKERSVQVRKNIKNIAAEAESSVDIDDQGNIIIFGKNKEKAILAREMVTALIEEPEAGKMSKNLSHSRNFVLNCKSFFLPHAPS